MPQLQPGDFAPQLIWLAIIFTLFYLALSNLVLPRIETALKARQAKLNGDLQAARDAQTHADEEAQRYDAEIATAKAKGQTAVRTAREKLEAELNEKRGVLDSQLAAKTAETEKRVQSYIEKASGEIESMTAGLVADIVKQLAGIDVSEGEVQAALKQRSKE